MGNEISGAANTIPLLAGFLRYLLQANSSPWFILGRIEPAVFFVGPHLYVNCFTMRWSKHRKNYILRKGPPCSIVDFH